VQASIDALGAILLTFTSEIPSMFKAEFGIREFCGPAGSGSLGTGNYLSGSGSFHQQQQQQMK
jgi:hypothetical protein